MLILAIGCNSNTSKGFTLIEILVVLFILGISVTLITLNFSSLNSIEKQAKSFEYTFDVLSQESILTGNIVAWYYDSEGEYAAYLFKNNKSKIINNIKISSEIDSLSLKKTFKFNDGITIDLHNSKLDMPLLVFYPSGEVSGGELDIYYTDYIQRIIIKNNGNKINKIINY
tara:strand:+ start:255 stop:767 length:513 start_codon:yes stop_codon:yes gene_type:complete